MSFNPEINYFGEVESMEKAFFESLLNNAHQTCLEIFRLNDFPISNPPLIKKVEYYSDIRLARSRLSLIFEVPEAKIPQTIGGTVIKKALYIVSPELYHKNAFEPLYSQLMEWKREEDYLKLILHELIHQAHESISISSTGSPDGMGPVWFFEGIATYLSRQFERVKIDNQWNFNQLVQAIREEKVGKGYLNYYQAIECLSKKFSINQLLKIALKNDFKNLDKE